LRLPLPLNHLLLCAIFFSYFNFSSEESFSVFPSLALRWLLDVYGNRSSS
jgi:hypothetical protein